jgi:hypothetical protein
MGAYVIQNVAATLEVLLDALLHLEARVVGTDRDVHGCSRDGTRFWHGTADRTARLGHGVEAAQ